MSAGILENDQMISVKETPWHRLGVVVQEAPSIEEAIRLANLGWVAEAKKLKTLDGIDVEGKRAIMRSDTNECLGIVSDGYQTLQNTEAFKFFEPFVENGLATLETAGSLWNGKKVFILAKIAGDDMVIDEKNNDIVKKYILLSNAHDGTQAVKVGYTPIRVVCNNTLTAAEEGGASDLVSINHTKNLVTALYSVQESMDIINRQFLVTEEKYKELAKMGINSEDLKKYFKKVFSTKKLEKMLENPSEFTEEDVENFRKKLISRCEEVFEMEYAHNRWTMYNAANYYLNHERSRNVENTYKSLWFGDARNIDRKALDLAFTI